MGLRMGLVGMGWRNVMSRYNLSFFYNLFFMVILSFVLGCSVRSLVTNVPFNNHRVQPPGHGQGFLLHFNC